MRTSEFTKWHPNSMGNDRPKILIVDDIKPEVDYLALLLGKQYDCDYAPDGKNALKKAAENPPDLILLDIVMPGIDGYEVCRRLKNDSRTRNIPVIFITSLSEDEEAKGLELGAVDYVTKPFKIPVIKARVRNHIELKRRGDLLERLAYIDSLTGISNRRGFSTRFDSEWRRASRTATCLSVIMIDIDNFKEYNDRYGHQAGDECLIDVARALSDTLHRATDFIARYGGEEFVALLAATSAKGAKTVAETMRTNITALAIEHAASPVSKHVTVSLGTATIVPGQKISPHTLLEAADRSMYGAKQNGRNQTKSVDLDVGVR